MQPFISSQNVLEYLISSLLNNSSTASVMASTPIERMNIEFSLIHNYANRWRNVSKTLFDAFVALLMVLKGSKKRLGKHKIS